MLTGRPDELDRRIVVEQAPAYGLVDGQVEVAFRVERWAGRQAATATADRSASASASTARCRRGRSFATGRSETFTLPIRHAGPTVLELEVEPAPDEVSALNNRAAVVVNGVRERLRVLLVSGQPHPGERTWRNLLKSDPAVDLVHFTILRPPEKDDATPLKELSLIVFPVQELFENKLHDFDLVVFDRYVVRGILPTPYYARIADYVRQGGALLVAVGPEFAGGAEPVPHAAGRRPAGEPDRPGDRSRRSGRRSPTSAGAIRSPRICRANGRRATPKPPRRGSSRPGAAGSASSKARPQRARR